MRTEHVIQSPFPMREETLSIVYWFFDCNLRKKPPYWKKKKIKK